MTFFVLCLTLGLLVTQRFKVLVLVPGTLLVLMVALAGGVAGNEALGWRAVMGAVGAATLQGAYLLGLVGRSLLFTARNSWGRQPLGSSTRPNAAARALRLLGKA